MLIAMLPRLVFLLMVSVSRLLAWMAAGNGEARTCCVTQSEKETIACGKTACLCSWMSCRNRKTICGETICISAILFGKLGNP